jgi:4-diphosphocytidyl-2-C-methyl-D-erythritol kinase
MATIKIVAPAKINLFLHVVGKRADGYHLLESLVSFADVGDEIELTEALSFDLTIDGPFAKNLPGSSANLVARAAQMLAEYAGRTADVRIRLTKNLPVASGIGGGSSDAAATLLGCAQLWNLKSLPTDGEIASHLGADVPVCLRRRPTMMTGIGEILADAPHVPDANVVLVHPGQSLNTSDVFRAYRGPFTSSGKALLASSVRDILATTQNDLQSAALSLAPAIGDILTALESQPGCIGARMSGSGATCFGLYQDRASATDAALNIKAAHAKWWFSIGRLGAVL